MSMRRRAPLKKYTAGKFAPVRKWKRTELSFVHFAAVVLLILFFLVVKDAAISPKISASFTAENVAALQIPGKTMLDLKELSTDYAIDFPELLALYCFENKFFPVKAAAPSKTDIEQNFIRNYDAVKKKYSKKSVRRYAEMFESVLTAMVCFPIPNESVVGKPSGYMYGESWNTGAGKPVSGHLFPGTAIFDRENVKGRLPVVSVSAGVVTRMGYHGASGYTAAVETDTGVTFTYAHLDSFAKQLSKGAKVAPGQLIGRMGNSGMAGNAPPSTGSQALLRFGVQVSGSGFGSAFWINPYPFLLISEGNRGYLTNIEE